MPGLIPGGAFAQCTSSQGFSCCGDLDGNGIVNDDDLCMLLDNFGCSGGCCVGDVDFDGDTDQADLGALLLDYNLDPPCSGPRPIPLIPWDDPNDPNDTTIPMSRRGVTFADLDADGWTDAATWVLTATGYQNSHERQMTWNDLSASPSRFVQGCLLASMPQDKNGYAQSLGDYNNDGFPDYVNEPRLEPNQPPVPVANSFIFLVNAGCGSRGAPCSSSTANFLSAANCLNILSDFGDEETETNCWGDLDEDGAIDRFIPAYPSGSHGNFFFHNDGVPNLNCSLSASCQMVNQPVIWGLTDETDSAQLGTVPLSQLNRPEGAVLVDYDCDGDLDVFVQDTVHQNITSASGSTLFQRLYQGDSNIQPLSLSETPEEGLLLADLDMDGDFDLMRNLFYGGLVISRSRGDGSFDNTGGTSPCAAGMGHGVSAADWDNDGDLDVTSGGRWHRNHAVEGWTPYPPPAPPLIGLFSEVFLPDDSAVVSALPSWADVDRDGDLDCARSKFVPADDPNDPNDVDVDPKLYSNQLHNSLTGCEESLRRYVSFRPVRPVLVPNGPPLPNDGDATENEFGAKVEIVIRDDESDLRRVGFTSSAAGYLTQNQYQLHFGLPGDPQPDDPDEDLHFDAFVDFVKPLPEGDAAEGPWRIDWAVNAALGDINLADLYADPNNQETWGRPITVYRDGRVRYAATTYDPIDPNTGDPNGISPARMYNLCGPLLLPEPNSPLPDPNSGTYWAGVRFVKDPNTPPVHVREVILDGQLDTPDPNFCAFNIVIVDVTDPNAPVVTGGLSRSTVAHNFRTCFPVPPDPNDPNAFILPEVNASRTYDVRVRVTGLREIEVPAEPGLDSILGIPVVQGLSPESSSGKSICQEVMAVSGSDPTTTPVTVRLSRVAVAPP